MAVLFPYRPKLRCFQDRTLYFSLLPRDILEYCLRPLLDHGIPRINCAEEWISPRLVKTIYLPEKYPWSRGAILANGNLILLHQSGTHLQIRSFATDQLIWSTTVLNLIKIRYNQPQDKLLIQLATDGAAVCYQVDNFSQIQTAEEFYSTFTTPLSAKIYPIIVEEWTQTFQIPNPEVMGKLGKLLGDLSIDSSQLVKSIFSGGYMVMVRQDSDHVFEYLEFYQCLD